MILIGIVGALSSLGQKMLEKMEIFSSDCRVSWTVDEQYANDDLQKSQFRNPEECMRGDLRPDLVLDFGPYETAFQRAKLYRCCGVPALMQGVLSEGENSELSQIGEDNNPYGKRSPIIVEPDFSVIKAQAIKNLVCQLNHLMCDVQRIYVKVKHNSTTETVRRSWLYWAKMINETLEEYTDVPTVKDSEFTLGFVRVQTEVSADLLPDEENIEIELVLGDEKGRLSWKISCSLLETRVEGVSELLDWYISQRKIEQALVMGEVLIDVLPSLI